MKYSVTTVALPEMSMKDQARFLSRLGYDGIELRVRRVGDDLRAKAQPATHGYHVNDVTPENFAAKAESIRAVLADHGLALAGIASNAACNDLEQVKLLLDGAVAAGAPFIRVGAAAGFRGDECYRAIYGDTIAGYARVLELAKGTGVKIVLEIHGGTIHPSAFSAFRIVSNFPAEDVGIIYDPQNMVRDGFETTALAVRLLGPYVAHCHVGGHRPTPGAPDEKGTMQWRWEACRLQEGLYHYPTMLANLQQIGYAGFISVEDFRKAPAEEKFSEAIAYLRAIE